MSNIERTDDAGLADFLATWRFEDGVAVTYAVIGLTNFGERPAPSTHLAEVLGRSISEAEALAQQWGWPGTRVADELISVDPERAKSAPRRHVRIGDRRTIRTADPGTAVLPRSIETCASLRCMLVWRDRRTARRSPAADLRRRVW